MNASSAPTAPERATPHPFAALTCFSVLSVLQRSLGLLLLPIFLRYLSPAEYGVLAIVTVAATLFAAVSNLKLDAAMRTFYFDFGGNEAARRAYLRQVFSTCLVATSFAYATMMLAGDRIFAAVLTHETVRFFPAGAIALGTSAINGCLTPYFVFLRNSLELRELVVWQLLLLLGTAGLQLLFVVAFGLGLNGVLWGALAATASVMLLLLSLRTDLIDWRLHRFRLRRSLEYSLPLVGLGLLYALGGQLDRLVLERTVDLAELGAYALLVSLFGLLKIVLNALDNTMRPYLYPALRRDAPQPVSAATLKAVYISAGLLALSVAAFLAAHLSLLTDEPAYLSARQWIPLAATAYAPVIFVRYLALFYELEKRSLGLTGGTLGRLAVLAGLLVVLVPAFGIEGALFAILVAELATAGLFRLGTARRFAAANLCWTDVGQAGLFIAVLWSTHHLAANASMPLFGQLQLGAAFLLLTVANRTALRELLSR